MKDKYIEWWKSLEYNIKSKYYRDNVDNVVELYGNPLANNASFAINYAGIKYLYNKYVPEFGNDAYWEMRYNPQAFEDRVKTGCSMTPKYKGTLNDKKDFAVTTNARQLGKSYYQKQLLKMVEHYNTVDINTWEYPHMLWNKEHIRSLSEHYTRIPCTNGLMNTNITQNKNISKMKVFRFKVIVGNTERILSVGAKIVPITYVTLDKHYDITFQYSILSILDNGKFNTKVENLILEGRFNKRSNIKHSKVNIIYNLYNNKVLKALANAFAHSVKREVIAKFKDVRARKGNKAKDIVIKEYDIKDLTIKK